MFLTLISEVNKALQELAGPGTNDVVKMFVIVVSVLDTNEFVAPNEGKTSSSKASENVFMCLSALIIVPTWHISNQRGCMMSVGVIGDTFQKSLPISPFNLN